MSKILLIYILIVLLSFFMFFFVEYLFVVNHEDVHKTIDNYYGCYDSVSYTSFSLFNIEGYTISNCDFTEEERLSNLEMHSINEIVSYNFFYIRVFLYLFFLLFILVSFLNKFKNGG
jgi:hypothetical protein